ncbi:MAG: polysaccharide deacetylase family protein [Elusimicrobia bacterium]|nr:polysaccharide deacetylase family protein [Elusimicrobiota bacterium]
MTIDSIWIPILCYHRVCPPAERGQDSPSLCVTPEQFSKQMLLLKIFGYKPITVQNLTEILEDRKLPPHKAVCITFDDGYKDNYLYAFSILKRFSYPAVIFLVTERIGLKNSWDSGSLSLLNFNEIEEMSFKGIQFGSHTASHLDLSQADEALIKKELEISKKKIEEITSRLDIPFCYPYSRLNPLAKQLVKEAGFICGFAGDEAPVEQKQDLFQLMRIQIFPSTSIFGFWKKLQPWYPKWMQFQKKLKKKYKNCC